MEINNKVFEGERSLFTSRDLKIYDCAPLKDIHQRVGKEIPYKKILAQIKSLIAEGIVAEIGHNRWVKYRLLRKM